MTKGRFDGIMATLIMAKTIVDSQLQFCVNIFRNISLSLIWFAALHKEQRLSQGIWIDNSKVLQIKK